MKSKVLITGIAGLIGSHFSRYLIAQGYEVVGIDNFSGGYRENLPEGVRCLDIDLADLTKVDKFFFDERPSFVCHFAAYAAECLSPFVRSFNYTNNLISSTNLITSSINYDVEKILFTSSMAVYGEDNEPPFTEDMQPKPVDPYGIAKYAVEMDLRQAREQFGLKYSIIRPHNVIGVYQNIWDKYRNVIGIWIRQAMSGEGISVFGDGLQKRAFSDMEFLNEPIEKLLSNYDGEIFNLGNDTEISILDAAKTLKKIAKKYGFDTDIVHFEPRHEVKYAFSNHNKAKECLGFKDETDIEKSMDAMFSWALEQPEREVTKMQYETTKNMYSYWRC